MPDLIRLIAGSRVADRSDYRRLERQHRILGTQERLATVPEVTYEQCSSSPTSVSEQSLSLRDRTTHPPSQEVVADPDLLAFYIAKATPLPPNDDGAFDRDTIIAPAFTAPAIPEMEGVGRYRVAKNASRNHRVDVLRRAMSDLTPAMVEYFARTGHSDADMIREAISNPISPGTRLFASASPNPLSQRPDRPSFLEYVNRRGSLVQHGFSPSNTPHSGSTDESIRMRKNSTYSITSASSDSQSVSRHTSVDKAAETAAEADANLVGSEIAVFSYDEDLLPGPGPGREVANERGRPTVRLGSALKRASGCSPRRADRQVRFREEDIEEAVEDSDTDSFETCTSTGA